MNKKKERRKKKKKERTHLWFDIVFLFLQTKLCYDQVLLYLCLSISTAPRKEMFLNPSEIYG